MATVTQIYKKALSAQVKDAITAIKAGVTEIDLDSSQVDNEGVRAIARALAKNNTVTVLSLADNPIDDTGAYEIANALMTNGSLKRLNMYHTEVTVQGVRALTSAIYENTELTGIFFGFDKDLVLMFESLNLEEY